MSQPADLYVPDWVQALADIDPCLCCRDDCDCADRGRDCECECPACRMCGCTAWRACADPRSEWGGCWWVEPELCSACAVPPGRGLEVVQVAGGLL